MKTYISDLIPKIQRFSKKLDDLTLLTNQHWVVIDDISNTKNVYIFRQNNQLLISCNGEVEKASWEYLGSNSLLIDKGDKSYLFKHGFFDENVLALKIDGKNEYAFLVNETKYGGELNSYQKIIDFLERKYINTYMPAGLEEKTGVLGGIVVKKHAELTRVYTPTGTIYFEGEIGPMNSRKIYADQSGAPALDGKYKIGFMWYIYVKNGIVTSTSII